MPHNTVIHAFYCKIISSSVILLLFCLDSSAQINISPAGSGQLVCSYFKLSGSGGIANDYTWTLSSTCGSGYLYDLGGNFKGTIAQGISEVYVDGVGPLTITLTAGGLTTSQTYLVQGAKDILPATARNTNLVSYQVGNGPIVSNPPDNEALFSYSQSGNYLTLFLDNPVLGTYTSGGQTYTTYAEQFQIQLPTSRWSVDYGDNISLNTYRYDVKPDRSPIAINLFIPGDGEGVLTVRLVACKNPNAGSHFNVSPLQDSLLVKRTSYFLPLPTISGTKVPCKIGVPVHLSTKEFSGGHYTWNWPSGYVLWNTNAITDSSSITLAKVGTSLGNVGVTIAVGTETRIVRGALAYDSTIQLAVAGQTNLPFRACSQGTQIAVSKSPGLTNLTWSCSPNLAATTRANGGYWVAPASGYNGNVTETGTVNASGATACGYTATGKLEGLALGLQDLTLTPSKIDVISDGVYPDNDYALLTATNYPNASYTWSVAPSVHATVDANGYNSAVMNPVLGAYGYPVVTVDVQTACGLQEASVQIHVHPKGYRVRPNPPIGSTETTNLEVTLDAGGGISARQGLTVSDIGAPVYLKDKRGTNLAQGVLNESLQVELCFPPLNPAEYTIVVAPVGQPLVTQSWVVQDGASGRLVVSPNPAVAGVDGSLFGSWEGISDTLGPFNVVVTDLNGAVKTSGADQWSHFTLDAHNLTSGFYKVHIASPTDSSLADSQYVYVSPAPHLQVGPIPTMGEIHGSLQNPVDGTNSLFLKVYDTQGTLRWSGKGLIDEFEIDLSSLEAGLYNLVATDGFLSYTSLITKL